MSEVDEAEIVTLVMDGGTAYVLLLVLGEGINGFTGPDPPRNVLIHAYNQIAGQLDSPPYDPRRAMSDDRG